MIVAYGGFALAILLAWQVVVIAAAAAAWRLLRREPGSTAYAVLATAILVAGLSTFPLQLGRALNGARDARRIGPHEAAIYGGLRLRFDAQAAERVRRVIPPGTTFYFDVKPREGGVPMRLWTRGRLLPRIEVDSLDAADWVVGWREDPRELGVSLGPVHRLGSDVWVARVQR